ncbi:ATP-dependent nuclease [Bathymodiolus thermophilus thioautotrophic gill symbiont]|uniref:Pathogenesis related protein n=1 Tax=Bathymodiolus thermophilus thioautotrophic gill symbiont TaxID=2360 RepID=A0A8H9CFE7_9GAMM|nr:ATP-dependent endonuclease [Bathymodiolus thermophilus thioautotrophic gill symbiont]CAB5496207.1 pathogenesis related protein [Bathymodiolus thermophilus thioautotrophic gill symbiont]
MQIKKIKILNFRLLKDFSIDLEDNLSLIIGKNNTGKTSLLSLLELFFSSKTNHFTLHDFNLEFQQEIKGMLDEDITKENYNNLEINLKFYIEYFESDNLKNISDFILNLDPEENYLILSFSYVLEYESYSRLKGDYKKFKNEFKDKSAIDFLGKNHKQYFSIKKTVVEHNKEENEKEIKDEQLSKIISLETINAKRDVSNGERGGFTSNKTLSRLSYQFYSHSNKSNPTTVSDLQSELIRTDGKLNKTYKAIFEKVVGDIRKFSVNDSEVLIKSNLEEMNILKDNTSVVYKQGDMELPEDYNGLGYMNLFAMVFKLHLIFDSFKKNNVNQGEQTDINLLFIEEPEAHTHPQMQYVFIKNIKNLLDKGKEELNNLQTIISTHSSHIASQSTFNDIKYFKKMDNQVTCKNLSNLENEGNSEVHKRKNFNFLKQYLTLYRAELFFAEKIIFIEGDTERILLPAMMKKIDDEKKDKGYIPLLSQNISVVEVGAYSHIFDKFLNFLGIKTLIITDIDSVDSNKKKCVVNDGKNTSNASIKHFLHDKDWDALRKLEHTSKILSKTGPLWKEDKGGLLCIAYQIEQSSYHARSFEDSFISINLNFIESNKDDFKGLKKRSKITSTSSNFYEIADNCIDKKTLFAMDILYYSSESYEEWEVPDYIKEGLVWLAK